MPKRYSSKHIVSVLHRHGFVFVRQKGSHATFRHLGVHTLTAIIPMNRKEIPLVTFRSILRQTHLVETDFE